MKQGYVIIIALVLVSTLSGCLGGSGNNTQQTMNSDEGDVSVQTETQTESGGTKIEQTIKTEDGDETTVVHTIETDEGTVTQEITATEGGEGWCQEGAEWTSQTTGAGLQGGMAMANAKILGIVSGGEFAGFCHATYGDNNVNVEVYFSEDSEHGHMKMTSNTGAVLQETSW